MRARLSGESNPAACKKSIPTILTFFRRRVGGTACEATSWLSSSSIACVASRGLSGGGAAGVVAVTVASVVGTVTRAVSYDAPVVRNVTAVSQDLGASAGTGILLLLHGEGFGSLDYSLRARVGGVNCR